MLGADYAAFEASMATLPVRGLRINWLKGDAEAILEMLQGEVGALSKIPFAECGYTFSAEHIGLSPLHHAGAIYVQEPAAMAPVAAVMMTGKIEGRMCRSMIFHLGTPMSSA